VHGQIAVNNGPGPGIGVTAGGEFIDRSNPAATAPDHHFYPGRKISRPFPGLRSPAQKKDAPHHLGK
jgi:hypothetical protein